MLQLLVVVLEPMLPEVLVVAQLAEISISPGKVEMVVVPPALPVLVGMVLVGVLLLAAEAPAV